MSDPLITHYALINDDTNNEKNDSRIKKCCHIRKRVVGRYKSKLNCVFVIGLSVLLARITAVAGPMYTMELVEGFSFSSLNRRRSVSAPHWQATQQGENYGDVNINQDKGNNYSSSFGLMERESFAFRSKLHKRLINLQRQLPTTLMVPLNPIDAQETYASNCTLVGPNQEVLGVDLKEMLSLSQTITTAVQTAQRARQLHQCPCPTRPRSNTTNRWTNLGSWIVESPWIRLSRNSTYSGRPISRIPSAPIPGRIHIFPI